ncbi:MAG: ExbD/TolR family protein [Desulfobaccales bacterium]
MKQHQRGPITEINMTPFVDIVLVILIIFMLTATLLLPRTFSIALPQATQADKIEKPPIIIAINAQGQIGINGVRLANDDEFEQVFRAQQQNHEPQAIIAADKEVRHGRLIEVIDNLKRLKVQRIGIEVEQR